MEKKEIALEGPLIIEDTKVYVAVEIDITCTDTQGRLVCSGVRRPTFVVIVSDTEKRAFTVGGEEVAIEHVAQEIGEIEGLG